MSKHNTKILFLQVRSFVRDAFYERAKLNVQPTKKGQRDIDESHDCFTMKYMSDKPINTLSGDQWLKLMEAEKAKLLEINLASDIGSFPKGKTFFQDVLEFFQYEAFSDMVKKWNALRKECLEHAFYKILYPMFRVEIRNKLTREAKGKHHAIVYVQTWTA